MRQALRSSLLAAVVLSLLATLTIVPGVHAQDDFCSILTPEEVGAAYGEQVIAEPTFDGCTWASADAEGAFVFVSAYWDSLPLAERKAIATGTEVTVGDRDAFYADEYFTLYIQLDQGVLALSGRVADGDSLPALQQLGDLVVERAAQLPAPASLQPIPSLAPMPSFESDPELEALFPDSIGGQPLEIQSMAGDQLFIQSDDQELVQEIEALLASQGLGLGDVSIGFGSSATLGGSITAARFPGADASAFTDLIIRSIGGGAEVEQTPLQIAGKDVVKITPASGGSQYIYAQGDVLWAVTAEEPTLTEIFTALP